MKRTQSHLRWLVVQFAAKLLALRWNSQKQEWTTPDAALPPDFISVVVGYAVKCKMRPPDIARTVEEARYQARNTAGRVVTTDIRDALLNYQIATVQALQNAFQLDGPAARPAIVTGQPSIDPIRLRGTGQTYTGHSVSPFSSESNLV